MTQLLRAAGFTALLLATLAYTAVADSYGVFLVATTALTAIACIGLNVLLGLAGQVSLGHVGFMAIGAYTTGLLMGNAGWPFLAAAAAGILLAGAVGGILAMPALRVRGPYLAMMTIAFGFIVEHGAVEWRELTGGGNGLILTAAPTLLGMPLSERGLAVLGVVLASVALVLFDRLKASGWGYAMRAARDSETAARSIGVDLVYVRTAAFVISAGAAALAGALFAPLNGFISPSSFPFLQSILFLLAVMVGGAGTTIGPVIGAAVVVLLPEMLAGLAEYRLLMFGVLLFAVLRLAPSGIAGTVAHLFRRTEKAVGVPAPSADIALTLPPRSERGNNAVAVEGLAVAFGGVRAVENLSFVAADGSVTSIIGPNGAGKTSALNLLCGFYRPDAGRVMLGSADITGLSSHTLARRGVARTFQTTQLFGSLTALENVMLAARRGRLGGLISSLARERAEGGADTARALLAFVGAGRSADRLADALSHGERRLVEIARALALRPRVLLLDEPAAGLSQSDKQGLIELLRRIADLGVTVILIEHDMALVMSLSDHIIVLDAGRCIADGTPEAVRASAAVRKAYLGEKEGERVPVREGRRPGAAPAKGLEAEALSAGYGASPVLSGISIAVGEGEAVAVLGANGAGKTTLLRALAGLQPPSAGGTVRLKGEAVHSLDAHQRARAGLVLVPEGRQVFAELTVLENLTLGAYARPSNHLALEIEGMLDLFPKLRERLRQRAGLLSGGEQQMLAVARGFLTGPSILMLDEPSLGLAPLAAEELFAALATLREKGMTLLVVDQLAAHALALSDRAYVLERGAIARSGAAAALAQAALERAYLGGPHRD
jgi:ABC-type branched-subunit amino acid transport system ATPase component/ABC-type branched-subunit amino acid transport system permease subunit